MINPKKFINFLKKKNIDKFIGVPDSVLKNLLSTLSDKNNFVSNNEGSAIAHAIGYHLATKKIPLVYMQNSGLGNAINPLISVAHKKVYSIPILLLIGWRGSPGSNDEPQHQAQGEVTRSFLKLLGIKFIQLKSDKDFKKINKIINHSLKFKEPVCILVENNKFEKINSEIKANQINQSKLSKLYFFKTLLKNIKENSRIISTTGYASRELNQIRLNLNFKKGKDFYMIGGMGHASNVGMGYAEFSKNETIILDGDGSFLMHLGSIFNLTRLKLKNFKYFLLNNGIHQSVGNQQTAINNINLKLLFKSLNMGKFFEIKSSKNLSKNLIKILKIKDCCFTNVLISTEVLKNLTRPKNFKQIKKIFFEKNKK